MRAPQQLLHSRTRLRRRYALFPLEGYPPSKLPMWPNVEARILTAPAMGAGFAEYLLTMSAGQGTKVAADERLETFFYVLSGEFRLRIEDDLPQQLKSGAYALVGPQTDFEVRTVSDGTLLMLRKAFEPISGVAAPRAVIGDVTKVSGEPFQGDEGARLQMLLPDELTFDLAMNIFTFEPGHSLPVVETHVMEHGLYFLQGKGMYYLDDEWMEVEAGDFIWMGPFVPQSFYATGPIPAKYIYYKNVNRDVAL
jgi:(S)-ureidoglycine aminohydrolase